MSPREVEAVNVYEFKVHISAEDEPLGAADIDLTRVAEALAVLLFPTRCVTYFDRLSLEKKP